MTKLACHAAPRPCSACISPCILHALHEHSNSTYCEHQSTFCLTDVRKDLVNIENFPGQHACCKEAISIHVVAGALTAKTGCHGVTRSGVCLPDPRQRQVVIGQFKGEKTTKDHAFQHELSDKLSIIPGCPGEQWMDVHMDK